MKFSWVAAIVLLSSTAATAANPGKAPAAEPAADRSALHCVEAPRTGSNIKRRTCMTKEQAEQRRKEDQLAADGLKRGSAGRSNSNKDPAIR